MKYRTTLSMFALTGFFLLLLVPSAYGNGTNRSIAVRVSVDASDHTVRYNIGGKLRLLLDDPDMFYELMALGDASEKGATVVFLIDEEVPIAELGGIEVIVDKYEIERARFFIYTSETEMMTELVRDEDGTLQWTRHTVPISEKPPEFKRPTVQAVPCGAKKGGHSKR